MYDDDTDADDDDRDNEQDEEDQLFAFSIITVVFDVWLCALVDCIFILFGYMCIVFVIIRCLVYLRTYPTYSLCVACFFFSLKLICE